MKCNDVCQTPNKLVVVYIVTQGIAILLTAVALEAPKWDNFHPDMPPIQKISVFQNLWTIVDHSSYVYGLQHSLLPIKPDEGWKKIIMLLITTGLAAGVLAEILLIISATVKKVTYNKVVGTIMLSLVFILTAVSASEVTYAAVRFKDDHLNILSETVYDPINMVPYKEYELAYGFYLCVAGGVCYALSALVILANTIKFLLQKNKTGVTEVTPVEKIDSA